MSKKLKGKAKQRARKLKKSTVNTILKNMEKTASILPKMLEEGWKIDINNFTNLQTADKIKFYDQDELKPNMGFMNLSGEEFIGAPVMFTYPEGMMATDKSFIANAIVYPPNSNTPIWTGNTNKLACYMNCLATGADRDKNERLIQVETHGAEGKTWMLQISVVGVKDTGHISRSNKELQDMMATVIKSLPQDIRKHFIGSILTNFQISKMTDLSVSNVIGFVKQLKEVA